MLLQRHQRAISPDSDAAPPFAGIDPKRNQFALRIHYTFSPFPLPWLDPSNERGCRCSKEFWRIHTYASLVTRNRTDSEMPDLRAISVPKWSDQFSIFLIPQDIS